MQIPYNVNITSVKIYASTRQTPSSWRWSSRLQLFWTLWKVQWWAGSYLALRDLISSPPRSRKRLVGSPNHTWFSKVQKDLHPLNTRLHTTWSQGHVWDKRQRVTETTIPRDDCANDDDRSFQFKNFIRKRHKRRLQNINYMKHMPSTNMPSLNTVWERNTRYMSSVGAISSHIFHLEFSSCRAE